jgi:hypothetical protein
MPLNGHTIIDGDGHVIEDCQAIINFMPKSYRDKYETHSFLIRFRRSIIFTPPTCMTSSRARSIKSAPTAGSIFWKTWVSKRPCFTPPSV